MSDLDTIVAGTLVALIVAGWCWYMGDDELDRQRAERWLRDTKRKQGRSNSTGDGTGSRCKSDDQSGCGESHAAGPIGPDQPR